MARGLLFTLIFLAGTCIYAQDEKYTVCRYTYFKNSKKISTSICYDKDNRWGIAKAFNEEGKEILSQYQRRVAGHANTHFSFHSNGAVYKAEFSDAPDAGIQWNKTTHEFDPSGKLIHFNREGTDNQGHPRLWITHHDSEKVAPYVVPRKKEVAICPAIYISEAWFVNKTRYVVRVKGAYTGSIADKPTVLLAPGDTGRGGGFVGAEQFANPAERVPYPFTLEAVGTRKRPKLKLEMFDAKEIKKDVKRYYFKIK
jgi:hypothetical protein